MRHPKDPSDQYYFNVHETSEILGRHRRTIDNMAFTIPGSYKQDTDDGRNFKLNFYTVDFILEFAAKKLRRGDKLNLHPVQKLNIPEVTERFNSFNSSQEVPLESSFVYGNENSNEHIDYSNTSSNEQSNSTQEGRGIVPFSMALERITELKEANNLLTDLYKNEHEEKQQLKEEGKQLKQENEKLSSINIKLITTRQKQMLIVGALCLPSGVVIAFVSWYIIHFQLIG